MLFIGIGILSGVGGGIVRDVLVATIPGVLQRELYAVAAFVAALVVVLGGGAFYVRRRATRS